MAYLYINSFRPLVSTVFGRDASDRYGLPPFVDGSIRREPDFEHSRPVITCLCRAGKFTPRLEVGDRVVYLTVHGRYGEPFKHHRLIAVMEVRQTFDSHLEAARWYSERGKALPNNLVVRGNPAKPLSHSVGRGGPRTKAGCGGCSPEKTGCGCSKGGRTTCGTDRAAWDRSYQERAMNHPRVAQCRHLLPPNLGWDAPAVTKAELAKIFGRDPHTRNPGKQDITLLPRLLRQAQLPVPPSCR